YIPPICDWMLVCGDRQREFWERAGCDSSRIIMIGQPRFDVYFDPPALQRWSETGLPVRPGSKTILFLSYNLDTYKPSDLSTYFSEGKIVGDPSGPWKQLRHETEQALLELADEGYTVIVKPHPQQAPTPGQPPFEEVAGARLNKSVFVLPTD